MSKAYEELRDLFFEAFHKDLEHEESKAYISNINELIVNPFSREKIRDLSFHSIAELLQCASPDALDILLSILSNEKLRSAISLLSRNQAEIISDKIKDSDQRNRFINLFVHSNNFRINSDIPNFFRKNNFINQPDDPSMGIGEFPEDIKYHQLIGRIESLSSENINLQKSLSSLEKKYENKISSIKSDFEKIQEIQEDKHNNKINELEQQYSELIQKRIDENLTNYVNAAVVALNGIEKELKFSAGLWSFIASATALITLAVGIALSLFGYYYGPSILTIQWPELLIQSLKGIFVIIALAGAASFAFSKSNAYTHEALIASNRAHAIQFGKLYLEIYGNTVDRSEMVKIFENWNISPTTAFSRKLENSNNIDISKSLDIIKKAKDSFNFSEK